MLREDDNRHESGFGTITLQNRSFGEGSVGGANDVLTIVSFYYRKSNSALHVAPSLSVLGTVKVTFLVDSQNRIHITQTHVYNWSAAEMGGLQLVNF